MRSEDVSDVFWMPYVRSVYVFVHQGFSENSCRNWLWKNVISLSFHWSRLLINSFEFDQFYIYEDGNTSGQGLIQVLLGSFFIDIYVFLVWNTTFASNQKVNANAIKQRFGSSLRNYGLCLRRNYKKSSSCMIISFCLTDIMIFTFSEFLQTSSGWAQ